MRNGSGTQVVFNPAFIVGTNTTGTHASGFVVITPAAATGTVTLTEAISGSGSIQKQGAGMLVFADSSNTWTGGEQVGHGSIETTATSIIEHWRLVTGGVADNGNTAVAILFNPTQSIRNLYSTYAGESGSDTSALDLFGTTLTVNATANHIFGYGPDVGLTATISDTVTAHGSLICNGSHGATLSLTGPNAYQGGTSIRGGTLNLANVSSGSATGSGNVEVKSGGELSSGGGVCPSSRGAARWRLAVL